LYIQTNKTKIPAARRFFIVLKEQYDLTPATPALEITHGQARGYAAIWSAGQRTTPDETGNGTDENKHLSRTRAREHTHTRTHTRARALARIENQTSTI